MTRYGILPFFNGLDATYAADMARRTVITNRWFVSVDTPKQKGPVSSRTPIARQTKTFPTESEAKQFARAMLAEGMKVTAGTLIPHQPTRRIITASDVNQWIEEEGWQPKGQEHGSEGFSGVKRCRAPTHRAEPARMGPPLAECEKVNLGLDQGRIDLKQTVRRKYALVFSRPLRHLAG